MSEKRIFILEDNEFDAKSLEYIIIEAGYIPTRCSTVQEARETFEQTGDIYGIYLLDMQGPDNPIAGAILKDFLVNSGVETGRIYPMSGIFSMHSESAAERYNVSPQQILSKAHLTGNLFRQLLQEEHPK